MTKAVNHERHENIGSNVTSYGEPMGVPRAPLSVLYIGGMGRSGSTLLERLVGQLPDVCNLGEVVSLVRRGIVANERCGCGDLFHDCPFWTQVGDVAFGGWDAVDVDRMDFLLRRVDDVRYTPLMLLPRAGRAFDRRRGEYTEFFHRLYGAAAQVSGATVIVDSSKKTSLVYALSHEPRLKLRLLHLLRDPRGVAYAWTKVVQRPEISDRVEYMPRFNTTYMSALWNGHNLLLAALRLRKVQTLTKTYEQFVTDPGATLADVANLLELPAAPVDFVSADGRTVELRQTHSVAGNPMRFQSGTITLRYDDAWRAKMSTRGRRWVTALTLPVALAFGYRPWRTSGRRPRRPGAGS